MKNVLYFIIYINKSSAAGYKIIPKLPSMNTESVCCRVTWFSLKQDEAAARPCRLTVVSCSKRRKICSRCCCSLLLSCCCALCSSFCRSRSSRNSWRLKKIHIKTAVEPLLDFYLQFIRELVILLGCYSPFTFKCNCLKVIFLNSLNQLLKWYGWTRATRRSYKHSEQDVFKRQTGTWL